MPTKWFQGRVSKIIPLSDTTRQFTLKIEDTDGVFDFLPGQFITMDLPVSEKRLHRWRSYSIANRPDKTCHLDLCIVRLDGGIGTTYLFDEIKVGHTIKFKGPEGGFLLPKDLNREIIMIATGTGLAPFRSMLQHIEAHSIPFHKIHLIFGTRTSDHILYKDELERLVDKYPNFKYSVALSKEEVPHFYKGYVHQVYLEMYRNPNPNRLFLLCGWSKMIDEAIDNLLVKLHYDKSQVIYELYG